MSRTINVTRIIYGVKESKTPDLRRKTRREISGNVSFNQLPGRKEKWSVLSDFEPKKKKRRKNDPRCLLRTRFPENDDVGPGYLESI